MEEGFAIADSSIFMILSIKKGCDLEKIHVTVLLYDVLFS